MKAIVVGSVFHRTANLSSKFKDYFEVSLFFSLTLSIYCLFIFTIPIAQETHGWIALNGFDNPLWNNGIELLIFGSALICALLGALMMVWVPSLPPEVTRNFWALTYFFIWIDTVFDLSTENQTFGFLLSLLLGLVFIFLFFYFIYFLGFQPDTNKIIPNWKTQVVQYWTWGWMSFYFALSFLLIFNSFRYSDFRLPLAFGALSVCFFNYILSLFIQKSEGKNVAQYSKTGRIVFAVWLLVLIACCFGRKWNF
jgi:hypothetical protein